MNMPDSTPPGAKSPPRVTHVTVYTREDCHLCDNLQAELTAFQNAHDTRFDVDYVDVDSQPELARRYGHKVPVVAIGSVQVCHYFFDAAALSVELALHQPPAAGQENNDASV
jgi:glutaredoxin